MTSRTDPILVAEDDDILRKMTLRQLEKLGFAGKGCANGREALEQVKSADYAMILMDVQMPVMDGLEATGAIREIERLKHTAPITIIGLTASPHQKRCMDAGMNDFMFKPVELHALEEVLNKWLHQ